MISKRRGLVHVLCTPNVTYIAVTLEKTLYPGDNGPRGCPGCNVKVKL